MKSIKKHLTTNYMKNQLSLCFFSLLFICTSVFAQSNKGFNYQAMARNNTGEALTNTPVNLRFQIREDSPTGTLIYQEKHTPTTNDYGLLQVHIGKGSVESGDFSDIVWASHDYYLIVELDGSAVDTSLFEAVPIAKVATDMKLEDLQDVSLTTPNIGEILIWNGTEWVPGADNTADADADPTNEIQALSLSGTTLSISNGNNVNLPSAPAYSAGSGIDITGTTISNSAPDQTVSLSGSGATSVSGTYPNFTINSTDNVDDADADPGNEIQSLSISGTTLSISNGNNVNLPSAPVYSAGSGIDITGTTISNTAPDQTVSLSGSGATSVSGTYPNFTINSTDNVNDADASTTNEIQNLSLSGNTLNLSLGGGSVNLASFTSPWNNSGSNIYFNTGNVGIGDNSPVATLTVGNGDKLQIHGSDGDIVFKDDQGSLRFANADGSNSPMIQMFQSGTSNSTRMLVAHSPSFSSWGIQYNDTADAFNWIGDNIPVFQVQLAGQQRIGVGTFTPESKFHVLTNTATGFGHIKLTEDQFDYSRITMNNTVHNNFWDIAARTDTNLANTQFNLYHSDVGDIFVVNARGRVGINDASPGYPLEINGKQHSRIINAYNNLPSTTSTTYNYGVRVNLSQQNNTGFPRLYNFYGISTDNDAYISYGAYVYASGASFNNYGIYAYAPVSSGYAGYFNGNTYATGSYQTSDARLKSDIQPLESGLEKVMQLQPKTYTYDRENYEFLNLPEGEQFGFLAQEVEALLPNLTNTAVQVYDEAKSDTPEGQGFEFKVVNYIGMIPVMVSAMQEQQATIEKQEDRIKQLEEKLKALETLIKK
jgi:hypothetical protein